MRYRYQLIDRENCHQGFFRLDRLRLRHEFFGGGEGPVLTREVLLRGHAVAVLPYDPERDRCVLIEQFRVGAIEHHEGPWLTEIVAGIVEPGEAPKAVARREVREETGGQIQSLEKVCCFFSSPGGSDEQVAVYCASVDSATAGGVPGLPEEGEDIRAFSLPRTEAMRLLDEGLIRTAPAVVALQWLALNHPRLQRAWSSTHGGDG